MEEVPDNEEKVQKEKEVKGEGGEPFTSFLSSNSNPMKLTTSLYIAIG